MSFFFKIFVFSYFFKSCKWEFDSKDYKALDSACDMRYYYKNNESCPIQCHEGFIAGTKATRGKIVCNGNTWSFEKITIYSNSKLCQGKTNRQRHYERNLKKKNKFSIRYRNNFKKVDQSVSLKKIQEDLYFDIFFAACNYGNFLKKHFGSAVLIRRNRDGKLAISEYGFFNFKPLSIILRCPLSCKAYYPKVEGVSFGDNCLNKKQISHGMSCKIAIKNKKRAYSNKIICYSGNWFIKVNKKFHILQKHKKGFIPVIFNKRKEIIQGFCPYLPMESETFEYDGCRYREGIAKCNYKCKGGYKNKKGKKTIKCIGIRFSEPDCEALPLCVCPDFGDFSKADCKKLSGDMLSVFVICEKINDQINNLNELSGKCIKGSWTFKKKSKDGKITNINKEKALKFCEKKPRRRLCAKPELRSRMESINCTGTPLKLECSFVCDYYSIAYPARDGVNVDDFYKFGFITCSDGIWSETAFGCFYLY